MMVTDKPIPITPLKPPPPLVILRCPTCQNRLADIRLAPGSLVAIKCAKCNTMVERSRAA